MGTLLKPLPVKLITGLISGNSALFTKTQKILVKKFGAIDIVSPIFAFDKTDYYEKEMGKGLKRIFVSFERLVEPCGLAAIKCFTNRLEKRLSAGQAKRTVNIDPGYVSLSKLVLATTKSYVHRIYVANGIFVEITLSYKNDTFQPGSLTYPDYRTESHITFFNEVRDKYYKQIEKKYGLSQLYRCV